MIMLRLCSSLPSEAQGVGLVLAEAVVVTVQVRHLFLSKEGDASPNHLSPTIDLHLNWHDELFCRGIWFHEHGDVSFYSFQYNLVLFEMIFSFPCH